MFIEMIHGTIVIIREKGSEFLCQRDKSTATNSLYVEYYHRVY